MHKLLFPAMICMIIGLYACNSDKKTETAATTIDEPAKIDYAYKATYSSDFEMGDPKNAQTILNLWKYWDNGDLSPCKQIFADTVKLFLRDGSTMIGPRDSIIAGGQAYRNNYSKVESVVHAFFPVRSKDKDEDWVCIWGTEYSTDKQGKVDSVNLQETWRLNKKGEVNLMYQHGQATKPPM